MAKVHQHDIGQAINKRPRIDVAARGQCAPVPQCQPVNSETAHFRARQNASVRSNDHRLLLAARSHRDRLLSIPVTLCEGMAASAMAYWMTSTASEYPMAPICFSSRCASAIEAMG